MWRWSCGGCRVRGYSVRRTALEHSSGTGPGPGRASWCHLGAYCTSVQSAALTYRHCIIGPVYKYMRDAGLVHLYCTVPDSDRAGYCMYLIQLRSTKTTLRLVHTRLLTTYCKLLTEDSHNSILIKFKLRRRVRRCCAPVRCCLIAL